MRIWILLLASFFLLSPPAQSDSDYKFKDSDGNEIKLPEGVPSYAQSRPGPWQEFAALHDAQVHIKSRKQGLETIRVVRIRIPHPTEDEALGRIQALYLLDKDNLMVGYHKFQPNDKHFYAEIRLNGVINYFQVYAHCSKHGLWHKEVTYEL